MLTIVHCEKSLSKSYRRDTCENFIGKSTRIIKNPHLLHFLHFSSIKKKSPTLSTCQRDTQNNPRRRSARDSKNDAALNDSFRAIQLSQTTTESDKRCRLVVPPLRYLSTRCYLPTSTSYPSPSSKPLLPLN